MCRVVENFLVFVVLLQLPVCFVHLEAFFSKTVGGFFKNYELRCREFFSCLQRCHFIKRKTVVVFWNIKKKLFLTDIPSIFLCTRAGIFKILKLPTQLIFFSNGIPYSSAVFNYLSNYYLLKSNKFDRNKN